MKLKVWTMKPSRTFDGEYFIFEVGHHNYNKAVSEASAHCKKTRGYDPEKIERHETTA